MKKLVREGLIISLIIGSLIYFLTKFDWDGLFKIKSLTQETEKKMGEVYWKFISTTEIEITDSVALNSIDSIISRICLKNRINKNKIKYHLISSSEVNAYALPGGHLVINSALITNCKNEFELEGVIAHEIAHIQLNHIKKKLVKEIGVAVLISSVSSTNGEILKQIVQKLTSTAYDRKLEKEADLKAVNYLRNAHINPKHLAHFLGRISKENATLEKKLEWFNTHPVSKDRVRYILHESNKLEFKEKNTISDSTWLTLKKIVN